MQDSPERSAKGSSAKPEYATSEERRKTWERIAAGGRESLREAAEEYKKREAERLAKRNQQP